MFWLDGGAMIGFEDEYYDFENNTLFADEAEELARKLGELIRLERRHVATQDDLAFLANSSRATISRLERGHSVSTHCLIVVLYRLELSRPFVELVNAQLKNPPSARERRARRDAFLKVMAPYL